MRIVIAPNAYKESLAAWDAARAIASGIRQAAPAAECILMPMADGGDGTMDTLVRGTGGRRCRSTVQDPLGRDIQARFGLLGNGDEAVIEMAESSGLRLLQDSEKNPMRTSTFGVGQLMQAALKRGATRLIVGVGGSATVDGGMGMAAALGYRFLDVHGKLLKPCGGNLHKIARIDASDFDKWRAGLERDFEISVACDVTNPLLGKKGAAAIFGPQKGATPKQVEQLETGLAKLAECVKQDLGISLARKKRAGAAGGLAGGLHAFCGARLEAGAEVIAREIELEVAIARADWVITGEGRIDRQTVYGKAPAEVAAIAARHHVPVIAIAGSVDPTASALYKRGFHSLWSLCDGPMSLRQAMDNAPRLLRQCGRAIAGIIQAAR
ncbi:MAG: glycerate kinase [Candidatus Sumerlaeia bacterium]